MALSVSFFWLGGYSIAYTYISPYLLTITGMGEKTLSTALFAFGIASLIGSKLGGYSTDRWGVMRTLNIGYDVTCNHPYFVNFNRALTKRRISIAYLVVLRKMVVRPYAAI